MARKWWPWLACLSFSALEGGLEFAEGTQPSPLEGRLVGCATRTGLPILRLPGVGSIQRGGGAELRALRDGPSADTGGSGCFECGPARRAEGRAFGARPSHSEVAVVQLCHDDETSLHEGEGKVPVEAREARESARGGTASAGCGESGFPQRGGGASPRAAGGYGGRGGRDGRQPAFRAMGPLCCPRLDWYCHQSFGKRAGSYACQATHFEADDAPGRSEYRVSGCLHGAFEDDGYASSPGNHGSLPGYGDGPAAAGCLPGCRPCGCSARGPTRIHQPGAGSQASRLSRTCLQDWCQGGYEDEARAGGPRTLRSPTSWIRRDRLRCRVWQPPLSGLGA